MSDTPSPPRPIRWYFEDFEQLSNAQNPASPVSPADPANPTHGGSREFGAMVVSREAVLAFASQFDPQPFHLDDAAAERSLFGRLSASGWHTCAMAMRMMCDDYLLESSSLGSPGIDELRWLKPVYPGDTLRVRLSINETRPMASRPSVGLVRNHWEVLNQHDQVVLSMLGWGMFGRRPGAVAN